MATIRPNGPGEAERSFRYAPLSSGLEIVRKALAQLSLLAASGNDFGGVKA